MSAFTKPGDSAFVRECQRLINARIAASSPAEKDDAQWALDYAMQMHRNGRFAEYLAVRAAQEPRTRTTNEDDQSAEPIACRGEQHRKSRGRTGDK